MTRLLAPGALAALHLALSAVILVWNLVVAGRIAGSRTTPPVIAALSGLAGLLLAPALFVALATSSVLTGRALSTIAWVWPATTLLIAAQATLALVSRRITISLGLPIVAYDILLTAVYAVRFAAFRGATPIPAVLALSAAQAGAEAVVATPLALLLPIYLHIPLLAPIVPPRRRSVIALRTALSLAAAAWTAVIVLMLPQAVYAVRSYTRYAGERLTERPPGDFLVGLKVFPTLRTGPPAPTLRSDLDMADSIGALALSVYIAPEGTTAAALDSLARAVEDRRRGGMQLVAVLHYGDDARARYRADPAGFMSGRVAQVERIARRLRPEYLVPAIDPYGAGARALDTLRLAEWTHFLVEAASAARQVDRRIRVVAHVGGFTRRDSVLYVWAARDGSPIDVLGLSLHPWHDGAAALDARTAAADRWMRWSQSAKEHLVLEASAYPLAHGEPSQELALWGALAWATSRSSVKALIVLEASDYGAYRGLRSAGGRIRPAARALARGTRALREQ